MKISYISASTIPSKAANSVHISKMCEACIENGHEINLILLRNRINNKKVDFTTIKEIYGLNETFNLKYYYALPGLKGKDFCYKAALFAKRYSDLVYTRYSLASSISTKLKIPTILEVHTVFSDDFKINALKKTVSSSSFKKLIVISEKLKDIYLEKFNNFLSADQIIVAHDGVNLKSFNSPCDKHIIKKKIGIKENDFLIGYTGSLYKGRGIEIILNLATNFKHLNFLIIGGNKKQHIEIQKEFKNKDISNIIFIPHVENKLIPSYLKTCDILLMPYQDKVYMGSGSLETSKFMSPLKMFEYMASNNPIISSDLPVLREVLNTKNSFLCSPNNMSEWICALNTLYKDKELSLSLANNAYNDVKNFSWKNRVKLILNHI